MTKLIAFSLILGLVYSIVPNPFNILATSIIGIALLLTQIK